MLGRSGIRAKGAATGVGPPVRRETGDGPMPTATALLEGVADSDSMPGACVSTVAMAARPIQIGCYRNDLNFLA